MGKHAIIIIKNKKNEYLQYFDKNWNSYLFMNCKVDNSSDNNLIIEKIEKVFKVDSIYIKCLFVGEKTHTKFSESAKKEKEYTHYFYKIELLGDLDIYDKKEFMVDDIEYKWFSYDELMNDKRIQKVNSDIVGYVKDFNL